MDKGKLIVFEGACDGIGKTTQVEKLNDRLIKEGNRIADLSKYTLLIPFANGTCIADDNEEAYLLDTKGNVIYPKENDV